jgi:hypothetical protein
VSIPLAEINFMRFSELTESRAPRHGLPLLYLSAVLLTGLAVLPAVVRACNVPVFRYALERWKAGEYEVLVLHRGDLTAQQTEVLRLLKDASVDGQKPVANFCLEDPVDLADPVRAKLRLLTRKLRPGNLPLLVVRYPVAAKINDPVWTAPLTRQTVEQVLQSPARRELADRLLKGHSAVWVLLESGDRAKDDAAAQLLTAELTRLEKTLKLPRLTAAPEDRLESKSLPLKLHFSVLRLSRTDPAEVLLREMLLHSEDDLPGCREPMVFPVYGRGRALYALIGKGINADTLKEAAQFLIGPCTCTLKEKNPGVDLLLTASWDGILTLVKDRELPPLMGPGTVKALPTQDVSPPLQGPAPQKASLTRLVNLEDPSNQWKQSIARFKKVPPLEVLQKRSAAAKSKDAEKQAGIQPAIPGANSRDQKAFDRFSGAVDDRRKAPANTESVPASPLLRNSLLSLVVGIVIVAVVYFVARRRMSL